MCVYIYIGVRVRKCMSECVCVCVVCVCVCVCCVCVCGSESVWEDLVSICMCVYLSICLLNVSTHLSVFWCLPRAVQDLHCLHHCVVCARVHSHLQQKEASQQ